MSTFARSAVISAASSLKAAGGLVVSSASVFTPSLPPDFGRPSERPWRRAGFHHVSLPLSLVKEGKVARKSSSLASAAEQEARERMKSDFSGDATPATESDWRSADNAEPERFAPDESTARFIQTSFGYFAETSTSNLVDSLLDS